jgi:acetyl-CoA acetyltransferase family protein
MHQNGREVVVVEAARTAIGRGHREKGVFRDVHPADLLSAAYRGVLERSGVPAERVQNVIAGCVQQFGEQGVNIARTAWLQEGLPVEASAQTIDLQCGSAQQAIGFAASQIASGVHDVVVAGGVEHMGRITFADAASAQEQFGRAFTDRLLDRHQIVNQGLAAELITDRWGFSRTDLDGLAVRSHALAHAAAEAGAFEREIVAVDSPDGPVTRDQGIRPGTNLETLGALKPAFKEGGHITAGNASQISDGAAAVLLMARETADELGVVPRARIVDQTSVGCDPVTMLEGPIPATAAMLRRNDITIEDIDRFEVNEAFAPVVAAWAHEHAPDMDRVNVRGGAMALGHPLGSSGARLITTLLHVLEDEDRELGLVTMCCAGGLGTATLLQRL